MKVTVSKQCEATIPQVASYYSAQQSAAGGLVANTVYDFLEIVLLRDGNQSMDVYLSGCLFDCFQILPWSVFTAHVMGFFPDERSSWCCQGDKELVHLQI